ncbi:RNase adapter protein RapZ [Oryzomicrobium terrae]|uniref:RNase adapter protein RapZ n=1 Tax=Oryzomicrobium terrae TaxID=1735038 RepID=A0A5C1E5W2_9RHOO|nr:RNase adapter RapZ [Oryzomicrobium terrae]QEL63677.1 RNase adapter protein RapZ [Oryzomicrobium terrae]
MHLVLISGLSGSGKSIALNVLEDAGYFCVDNLPTSLLPALVDQLEESGYQRVAAAVDVRAGAGLAALPGILAALRPRLDLRFLFLNAKDETLVKRFSETRRRHPLARDGRALLEAIREERERLADIGDLGHHIDTSELKPAVLREWVRQFVATDPDAGLTLLFQSFGFKHGVPQDADLVFDVRCLPNPYYDPALRPLTGQDQPVIDFLAAVPDVAAMAEDIRAFVTRWLPAYIRDNRAYLTVAIGCTGGQHRSVYLTEWLAARFRAAGAAAAPGAATADPANPATPALPRVLVRHRELSGNPAPGSAR